MRKFLAVISGAIVGSLILFGVGMIANALQPTPPELMDPATPQAVSRRVASTTIFSWLSTIFGLALGAFAGGALGAKIDHEDAFWVTGAIGCLLSLWAFYTFYVVYPVVLWVPLFMLISVFLCSYLGGVVIRRRSTGW